MRDEKEGEAGERGRRWKGVRDFRRLLVVVVVVVCWGVVVEVRLGEAEEGRTEEEEEEEEFVAEKVFLSVPLLGPPAVEGRPSEGRPSSASKNRPLSLSSAALLLDSPINEEQ